ncbi:hypothetical protein [Bordetella avium]|uniref:hypothetical protein n=1 Tax=Bordetella avium TaxID=521 RepID=UPI0039FD5201
MLALSVGHPPTAVDTGVSHSAQTLVRDWLQLPEHWAMVRAQAPGPDGLVRHTLVAAGDGHAVNSLNAQRRVAGSDLGWRQTASQSQRQAQAINQRLRVQDMPWGGRQAMSDWLTPWADALAVNRRSSGGAHD